MGQQRNYSDFFEKKGFFGRAKLDIMTDNRIKCTSKPTLKVQEKPIITKKTTGGSTVCDYFSLNLLPDPFAMLRADGVR
jgi:hypothetical protein